MDGDHCTVDGTEVLDRVVIIPSRLFNTRAECSRETDVRLRSCHLAGAGCGPEFPGMPPVVLDIVFI